MAFSMSVYFGTGQVDSHTGGSGRDWIWGEAGNDRLAGGAGDDFIYGGAGADGIYGGLGSDVLFGGKGNDRMDGGIVWDPATNDRRDPPTEGNDVIYGGDGDDQIRGGGGDDVLFGDEGDDYLTAQTGDDVLYGGGGEDRLQSSWGDDVLIGGPAKDEFDFRYNNIDFGTDLITDFKDNEDEIQLWDGFTDAQKVDLVRGITYSGPSGAYTSATIDLSDLSAPLTSGVIKVLFDGTGDDFTIDDFWSSS